MPRLPSLPAPLPALSHRSGGTALAVKRSRGARDVRGSGDPRSAGVLLASPRRLTSAQGHQRARRGVENKTRHEDAAAHRKVRSHFRMPAEGLKPCLMTSSSINTGVKRCRAGCGSRGPVGAGLHTLPSPSRSPRLQSPDVQHRVLLRCKGIQEGLILRPRARCAAHPGWVTHGSRGLGLGRGPCSVPALRSV